MDIGCTPDIRWIIVFCGFLHPHRALSLR